MPTSYSIVLISAAIGILPVFIWLWFIAKRDGLTIGNLNLLIKVFFWGVLAAVPASIVEIYVIETQTESQLVEAMQKIWFHQETLFALTTFLSAGFVALIEEGAKALGIAFSLLRRRLTTSNDGMMFGMIVGLAFAVTENGVYFASALQSESGIDFWGIVMLRFLLSTSAHIIYSGVMGMFFAEAKLAATSAMKVFYAACGVALPIIIHTTFNSLLGLSYSRIVVVIVAVGFGLMWWKYSATEKKRGIKIS